MKIAIIGTGYVGLVTGTCFAELGNNVICVDRNKTKIAQLKRLSCPIHEPGLAELIKKNIKNKRLSFQTNGADAIQKGEIIFNCVGTPLNKKGLPDLTETYKVARLCAENLSEPKIFVNKSTVPVGTGAECQKIISSIAGTSSQKYFDIVSNPEFLRQGTAIKDFMEPERIIVGTESKRSAQIMKKLYAPFLRKKIPVIFTNVKTAEMVKYAANAFIATKISFINEIARYCQKTGINIKDISKAIGLDSRIGQKYLRAGIGYGGGCLSKDMKSLITIGKKANCPFGILEQVSAVNSNQRKKFIKKITTTLKKYYKDTPCEIAIWGLAYKPETDDLRDSPAVEIIKTLNKAGHILHLYDPAANINTAKIFRPSTKIKYFTDKYQTAKNTHALLLLTEWNEFKNPDFKKLKSVMKGPLIFDGRNVLNKSKGEKNNLEIYGT